MLCEVRQIKPRCPQNLYLSSLTGHIYYYYYLLLVTDIIIIIIIIIIIAS